MRIVLLLLTIVILFSGAFAHADENPRQAEDILLQTYLGNMSRLERNNFGLPLFLESSEGEGRVHVDVYGIFDSPFNSVVDMLKIPANWCDIVSLHQNVKSCTYRKMQDEWQLTFYIGRKVYQPPEDAHQVIYRYRNVAQRQGYLDVILSADTGPFGTKDHRMRFEAMSLNRNRTFVHVSYSYSDSAALRLAAKVYFATVGRDKAGFTVTGRDRNGDPVYIGGPRGSIERNAVRYYFAIQTFMNTLRYPEKTRFSKSISEWYTLTTPYKRQLYELSREDYITIKTQEHRNQLILQRSVGAGRT